MSQKISTEIEIKASTTCIWHILMDFERYPEWNPFITQIYGKAEPGSYLNVQIMAPESKAMGFTPLVLKHEPKRLFCWKGKLLIKGLFDGEHQFELIENEDGSTLFRQSESFSGVIVQFFRKMIHGNTRSGFELMNQALKKRSEAMDLRQ